MFILLDSNEFQKFYAWLNNQEKLYYWVLNLDYYLENNIYINRFYSVFGSEAAL